MFILDDLKVVRIFIDVILDARSDVSSLFTDG